MTDTRLRVLHLLGSEADSGGILSVIRSLRSAMVGDVDHVVLVNEAYREVRSPSLEYRRSRFLRAESGSHFELLIRGLAATAEVRELLRRERFDVVHAHSRGGLVVAAVLSKLFGQRLVFTNHALARRTWLYRRVARSSTMWTVVLTPSMLQHYRLKNDPNGRVHVMSACVGDGLFGVPTVRRRNIQDGTKVRVVGVGTIVPSKKWHLVPAATSRLSESLAGKLQFDLWGPTPDSHEGQAYERRLRELCRHSGLCEMRLRGPTARVDVALRDADWFILPSSNEACSVALLEALALGVPVIASASGGNVNIVQDERTGLLFAPDNPMDLSSVLARVACGKTNVKGGEYIRESVRSRAATVVAGGYQGLYLRVARGERQVAGKGPHEAAGE